MIGVSKVKILPFISILVFLGGCLADDGMDGMVGAQGPAGPAGAAGPAGEPGSNASITTYKISDVMNDVLLSNNVCTPECTSDWQFVGPTASVTVGLDQTTIAGAITISITPDQVSTYPYQFDICTGDGTGYATTMGAYNSVENPGTTGNTLTFTATNVDTVSEGVYEVGVCTYPPWDDGVYSFSTVVGNGFIQVY